MTSGAFYRHLAEWLRQSCASTVWATLPTSAKIMLLRDTMILDAHRARSLLTVDPLTSSQRSHAS